MMEQAVHDLEIDDGSGSIIKLKSLLISGKGYPDYATRRLLARIVDEAPKAVVGYYGM